MPALTPASVRVRASERVVWLTRGIGWARTQGKLDEALPYYEQALAIRKKVYGEEHPKVAIGLNNLAQLLQAQASVGPTSG